MSEYIREGGRSFHKNKGQYINPYSPGSAQYNDFERGWSQALKRSPERLIREYFKAERTPSRPRTASPELFSSKRKKELPEDIYVVLAERARERLLNESSYRPPEYGWPSKVYYARVEAYERPLWKIGVTCNNLRSRYCIADRRLIVEVKSWSYATREEAEAIEREILAEFADDLYEGDRVLRSGGDSELFTRDVLMLDSQDDFLAIARGGK